MAATTAQLLQELLETAQSVETFGDRSFKIFNMEEIKQRAEFQGYPVVVVGYEGAIPAPGNQGLGAQGRASGACDAVIVNKRFTIMVGVEYNYQGELDDDNKDVATDLLDEVRGKLLGFQGVNSKPWRFVAEGPSNDYLDGVIFYAQTWETQSTLTGNDAQ